VKQKIDALEQEIDEVKARVKELEQKKGNQGLDNDEKKELEQKRDDLTAALQLV
jgi:hypothetical protein